MSKHLREHISNLLASAEYKSEGDTRKLTLRAVSNAKLTSKETDDSERIIKDVLERSLLSHFFGPVVRAIQEVIDHELAKDMTGKDPYVINWLGRIMVALSGDVK